MFNAGLSTGLKLLPSIVTLGTMQAFRGAGKVFTNGSPVNFPFDVTAYKPGMSSAGIPWGVWLMMALAILFTLVLRYTRFGRHVFVIGTPHGCQAIETLGTEQFKTGRLAVKIHRHDYATITADATPAKFTRIRLLDTASGNNAPAPRDFPQGTSQFYLAELRGEDAPPAELERLLDLTNGLTGFMVKDKNRTYRDVFNPTAATQVWRMSATATARLYRDGERYRSPWISRDGREEPAAAPSRPPR